MVAEVQSVATNKMAEDKPASCWWNAKAGQKVVAHSDACCGPLLKCDGRQPLHSDIILAEDLVGTFRDDDCPSVKIEISCRLCCNDCFCGCCCCGPIPLCPIWASRSCWNCKHKVNTFSLVFGHGALCTFSDKDHFASHWLCCPPIRTFTRVGSTSAKVELGGAPPSGETMQR